MLDDKQLSADEHDHNADDQRHDRELIEAGFKDFETGEYLIDADMRKRFAQYGWQ